jgi:DNA-binding NtrC family response regulator
MARILVIDKNNRVTDDLVYRLRQKLIPTRRLKTVTDALLMLKIENIYDIIIIRSTYLQSQDGLATIESFRQNGHERGAIIVRVAPPESDIPFQNLHNCHTAQHNNQIIELIDLLEH